MPTPLAGDPAFSRRVSGAKSQKFGLDKDRRKVMVPGREVELSLTVLGNIVLSQRRRIA